MKNKVIIWIFALWLMALIANPQTSENDWNNLSPQEKWNTNRGKFLQERGVKEISGDFSKVQFDGQNTIINQGVSLNINEIKGAKVTALDRGGFKVEFEGKLTVKGTTFDMGEGQSLEVQSENSVLVSDGIKTNEWTAQGNTRIDPTQSQAGVTRVIEGKLVNERGFVAGGKDFFLHNSLEGKIPFSSSVYPVGNHIYVEGENFVIKGIATLTTNNINPKNTYEGTLSQSFIWSTPQGVRVDATGNFPSKITIARFSPEISIDDNGDLKKVKLLYKFTKENNEIGASLFGKTDELYRAQIGANSIARVPGVNILLGAQGTRSIGFKQNNFDYRGVVTFVNKGFPQISYSLGRGTSKLPTGEEAFLSAEGGIKALGGASINAYMPQNELDNIIKDTPDDGRLITNLLKSDKLKVEIIASTEGFGTLGNFLVKASSFGNVDFAKGLIQDKFSELGEVAGLSGQDLQTWTEATSKLTDDSLIELDKNSGKLRIWTSGTRTGNPNFEGSISRNSINNVIDKKVLQYLPSIQNDPKVRNYIKGLRSGFKNLNTQGNDNPISQQVD